MDVRFICTTCRDLGQLVEEGRFRKELYYRLNVLSLVMPSLKDRRQDIVPLAESFIVQHSTKLGRRPAKLSKSCVDFLQQYPWPGNVRQLQNALYRALSLLDGKEITKEEVEKGPNNGRVLRQGDLAIELAIYETDTPPEFRVYASYALSLIHI